MKLYSVLEKLGKRVLYYDTDSVVFTTKPPQVKPELGDFLGELTSELPPNTYITKFISAGPKNYSYVISSPCPKTGKDTFCKVKGINLNFDNLKLVNCETMEKFVKSPGHEDVVTIPEPSKIIRDPKTGKLLSRDRKKDYRVVYTKRVITENYGTIPYGY